VCKFLCAHHVLKLLQLCLRGLAGVDERSLILCIVDTISTYVDVWVALDAQHNLALALASAHERLQPLGRWPIPATAFLLELAAAGYGAVEIRRTLSAVLPQPVHLFRRPKLAVA
jgi:hypothetical protein